jgi:crossover junction endodeoxyribonuclease RuvC
MRILGIDPGTRITGYGCVDLADGAVEPCLVEAGVLKFNSRTSLDDRLAQMHEDVAALIAELKPDRLAVEKLYSHYKHPRTAIIMAHGRGVILLAAAEARIPIEHLPATAVKKSLTGNGHASKHQMQHAVQAQLRLARPPTPPDVADAIAIALCLGRRLAFERL